MSGKSKTPTTRQCQDAILWALKLDGDINEAHAGGDAAKELKRRLRARGFEPSGGGYSSGYYNLRIGDKIEVLKKDGTTYAIRLVEGTQMPEHNPLAGNALAVPDPLATGPVKLLDLSEDIRQMPVSARLTLISQLSASVVEDIATHKQLVAEAM